MYFYTIIYLIICLILIAFFSGIEIAFVSLKKISIDIKKKQGNRGAKFISNYLYKPDQFITSSLVGLNIVLIFFGILFNKLFEPIFNRIFENTNQHTILIFLIEIIISTLIVFLLGEFFPKTFFKRKNTSLLIFFAPIIYLTFLFIKPITTFFIILSDFLLKNVFKIGSKNTKNHLFKYVDLERLIEEKTLYEKSNTSIQNLLLKNILQFSKTQLRNCLIPRNEIIAININSNIESIKKKISEANISRIIVYKKNLDNIIGYIHHLDLFKNPSNIKNILITIPTFSETTKINQVLSELTKNRKSLGWVIDEYGVTAGIITIEKILEEVFGKDTISDEYYVDTKLLDIQISEKEYIFSGRLELDFIQDKYKINLPKTDNTTLSGFLINQYGSIPKKNDLVIYNNYIFLILEAGSTKVEKINLKIN